MKGRFRLIISTVCLFLLFPDPAGALTIYLKNEPVTAGTRLTVGDLGGLSGGAAAAAALLDNELAFSAAKLSLIPAAFIRQTMEGNSPESLVIIGGPVAVIPQQLTTGSCPRFYTQLLAFLAAFQGSRDYRMDVELLSPERLPADCRDAGYQFTLLEHSLASGCLAGEIRLFYDNRQGQADFINLQISQYPPQGTPGTVFAAETAARLPGYIPLKPREKQVRAGDKVMIDLYKGNIRLRMEGLAFSSGAIGQSVPVKPSTTNKRFNGVVTGQQEVRVEIE